MELWRGLNPVYCLKRWGWKRQIWRGISLALLLNRAIQVFSLPPSSPVRHYLQTSPRWCAFESIKGISSFSFFPCVNHELISLRDVYERSHISTNTDAENQFACSSWIRCWHAFEELLFEVHHLAWLLTETCRLHCLILAQKFLGVSCVYVQAHQWVILINCEFAFG